MYNSYEVILGATWIHLIKLKEKFYRTPVRLTMLYGT